MLIYKTNLYSALTGEISFRRYTLRLLPSGNVEDEELIRAPDEVEVVLFPKGEVRRKRVFLCESVAVDDGAVDEIAALEKIGGDLLREKEAGLDDEGVGVGVRAGEVEHFTNLSL